MPLVHQLGLLVGTFLVVPLTLVAFDYSVVDALMFCIFIAALLADAFMTSLGLKHGLKEFSPLFSILNGKVSENWLIVYSTIMGVALGVIVLLALPAAILLFLTAISLMGVVGNSYSLSKRLGVPQQLHQTDEG